MKGNIYIIGFMGTGKTTVSRLLAEQTGFELVDTDQEIAGQQKKSINEIFESQGEGYFRNLETELLRELGTVRGKIVSCGGGMVLREENVRLMKESGVVVLLTACSRTIFSRVCQGTDRPVLNKNMSVEYVEELLEKRKPYYERAGEVIITTDDRTPEEISGEINKILKNGKISFDF